MFGLLKEGVLIKWPIGLKDLQEAYPSVSFIVPFNPSDYSNLGVVEIFQSDPPSYDFKTQKIVLRDPVNLDGVWKRIWVVEPLTPEEIAVLTEQQAAGVRLDRNSRLAACDWTQLADSPLSAEAKAAWAFYRENLRMVPQQAGFPWEIQWPPEPNA